jgi:hypothetical protein
MPVEGLRLVAGIDRWLTVCREREHADYGAELRPRDGRPVPDIQIRMSSLYATVCSSLMEF